MKLSFGSLLLSICFAARPSLGGKVEISVDDGPLMLFDTIDAKAMTNISSWYSWGTPQRTSANTPKDKSDNGLEFYNNDATGIAAVETDEGVSVALIFDNYDVEMNGNCLDEDPPKGGHMKSEVTCTGECSSYPDPKFMDVLDDKSETFSAGEFLFRNHRWYSCRTDGYATDVLSEKDTVCINFPKEDDSGFGVENGIRFYEMVKGDYTPTVLLTETIGHKVCITIACTKKLLLAPCEEDNECCSGMCTGRKPERKKCRYCARKQEMCDTTDDCCQSDFGRVCHPEKKKCVRCTGDLCPN